MTDEQRPLIGYTSKIHEAGEFENQNEGKHPLDDQEEYIIRLNKMPVVKQFPQIKELKDGTRKTITVDKAVCEFEDETYHNIVMAFFRVDSLNFSDDEAFESGIIRFFKRIGNPITPSQTGEIDWSNYFQVGMRFRGRVAVGRDSKDKKPDGKYYIDVPTCRKILQSDFHPEATAHLQGTSQAGPSLLNLKLIAKGAVDEKDALVKLAMGGASSDDITAFLVAIKKGEVAFPI